MSADIKTALERMPEHVRQIGTAASEAPYKDAEIADLRAELARPAVVSEGQAVHFVRHPTPGKECNEWTEVKPDRFQKLVDAGFVTRTLYARPAAPAPEAPTAAQAPEVFAELLEEYLAVTQSAYCQCDADEELVSRCQAILIAQTGIEAESLPPLKEPIQFSDGSLYEDSGIEEYFEADYVRDRETKWRALLATKPKAAPVAEAPTEPSTLEVITKVQRHLVDTIRAFGDINCAAYISTWHKPAEIAKNLGLAVPATEQAKPPRITPKQRARLDGMMAEAAELGRDVDALVAEQAKAGQIDPQAIRDEVGNLVGTDAFEDVSAHDLVAAFRKVLAMPAEPMDEIYAKAGHWFECLNDCAKLLELPDDEPIPSGVVKALTALLAAQASPAKPDLAGLTDEQVIGLSKEFKILKIDTTPTIENGCYVSHTIRADVDEGQLIDFAHALLAAITKEPGQ